jgi:DNA-directed RNA polymerase subunit M/transcription elongation factor TFIIS
MKTLADIINDNTILSEIKVAYENYSKDLSENNNVPSLLDNIYNDKVEELVKALLTNYGLLSMITSKKMNISTLPYLSIDILFPLKYQKILQTKENNKLLVKGSDAFKCERCGKSNSQVTQKQTRAADEAPTTFVTCNECGHGFKFG